MSRIVLGPNQYGKAECRLVRVNRDQAAHTVEDLTVTTQLRGDFEAYTRDVYGGPGSEPTPPGGARDPDDPDPPSSSSPFAPCFALLIYHILFSSRHHLLVLLLVLVDPASFMASFFLSLDTVTDTACDTGYWPCCCYCARARVARTVRRFAAG